MLLNICWSEPQTHLRSVAVSLSSVMPFEGRPRLALVCVDGLCKIILPEVIFERDYFFVSFDLSHTHIIFGMRTPYGPLWSKKELLGMVFSEQISLKCGEVLDLHI